MKFKRVLIVALVALVLLSAAACVIDDEHCVDKTTRYMLEDNLTIE